jgi:hypothetical protein
LTSPVATSPLQGYFAIRRALSQAGVLVSFSKNNGLACVSISFATDEGEEEE